MASSPNPTGVANGVFDRVTINGVAVIPRDEHETSPITQPGAVLYDKSDRSLYLSDGVSWNLVGGPASEVHLNPVAGAAGTTLIADGVGPVMSLKSVAAGAGITVSSNGTDVTITNSISGSAASLGLVVGASGESLVGNGVGPALTIKGLIAGSGITITASGSTDLEIGVDGANNLNNLRINSSDTNTAAATGTNSFALGHNSSATGAHTGVFSTSDGSATVVCNTDNSILFGTVSGGTYAPFAHTVAKGTGALDGYFMMAGTALYIPYYQAHGNHSSINAREFVNACLQLPVTQSVDNLTLPSWALIATFLGGSALDSFTPGLTGWSFRLVNATGNPFTLHAGPQRGYVSGTTTCFFQDYDGTQTESFTIPNNKNYEFAVIAIPLTGVYGVQYVGCLNIQ
jgi:hypothetical protein